MMACGACIIGLGIFLSCIVETRILGIPWGISIGIGAAAGGIAGSIIGGIGVVCCGTGIGLPGGILLGILGALISAVGSLPFFVTKVPVVPPVVSISIQVIGWLMFIAGIFRYCKSKQPTE